MEDKHATIVSNMRRKKEIDWSSHIGKRNMRKRLNRNKTVLAASFALIAVSGVSYLCLNPDTKAVMGQMNMGFTYDDSFGRLQFVSNILPESAMVFLQTEPNTPVFSAPSYDEEIHAWSEAEPWIEYMSTGDAVAAADGEIMTVVLTRAGEYTVRILHPEGYESIHSGLSEVNAQQGDTITKGQRIGKCAGEAAYELRKDGLSIRPVFQY